MGYLLFVQLKQSVLRKINTVVLQIVVNFMCTKMIMNISFNQKNTTF